MENFKNVVIFDHPLIQHKIGIMRDKNTSTKEFRALVAEVAQLVAQYAAKTQRGVGNEIVEQQNADCYAKAHKVVACGQKVQQQ